MGANNDQGEDEASPGGQQKARPPDGTLEEEQHQRQPGKRYHDVVPAGQNVQEPLAREHVADRRYQDGFLPETLASGVGHHAPARDHHVEHDQPAHARSDPVFREQVERQVEWIKGGHLNIVDERHAAEAIRTPERHLARLLP